MRRSLLPLLAFTTLAAPSLAPAHFLWASLDPSAKTVAVGLQELPSDSPLPLGARAGLVKAWSPTSPKLTLKADGNWLKAGLKDSCAGVSLDYGVIDRGQGVYRLNYFAKAAATPSASQTKLGLPVELTLTKSATGEAVVTVLAKGQPAPGAEVVVARADGTVVFEGKSGVGGVVMVSASAGPLAIRGLVTEPTKGTREGKAYEFVRSYGTLTVQDTGMATVAVPGKLLTRQIREAFGENHDIVGKTAFVRTLMTDQLTKPQLEAHFQQHALIHQAVEDVLLYADASKPVPYGEEQKQVLKLLRSDLVAMGSEWPDESKAWPLTKKLIQDIKDSAKSGPFFALGVMHVYYGGITHGGRDIGARIAKILNVPQTYYLKSDGYSDYAEKVNTITNPADQKEMIRGGVAAYKYIITSNDDPVFKSK